MVTSALAADGKTMTAVNLSLVLSEAYRRRVLLVEGDLRRPAISRAAGVPAGPGLSEALKAHDDRKPSLVQLTDTLTLLPAGQPDSDPLSGLTSARLQALIQDASEKFDWVIVDTPPLAATTDATLLCPLVEAVLLVVRAGRTPLEGVKQAIDALGRDRILGVVLNASDQAEAGTYEYYSDDADADWQIAEPGCDASRQLGSHSAARKYLMARVLKFAMTQTFDCLTWPSASRHLIVSS